MIMTEDWNDCADNDISMRETSKKAKISDRLVNAVIILHTMTIFAYCFGVFFANVDVIDQTTELPHMTKLVLPFRINTQRMYRLVLIVQFLHLILCAWAAGITNILLLSLVNYDTRIDTFTKLRMIPMRIVGLLDIATNCCMRFAITMIDTEIEI